MLERDELGRGTARQADQSLTLESTRQAELVLSKACSRDAQEPARKRLSASYRFEHG
jgi:hypothetical protein